MGRKFVKAGLGKRKAKNKWLKTQKGKKAVSIAKLYFDDECLIDEANVKSMLTVLRPFVDKPKKISSSSSSYNSSSNEKTNVESCNLDCWLSRGEKIARYINVFNTISSFLRGF